uniref:ADAM metallopeptidase domain 28 n=1 Tax=Denticeps clupeoides TaxID=299321 RepID=A0AAY4DWS1_9TELE
MSGTRLLLWILTTLTLLHVLVSKSIQHLGVKVYDVVQPIRLHDLHKRQVERSNPNVLNYGMNLHGREIVMHLEQNEGLLTKDYSETRYTENGTRVTTTPEDLDHCYYQGHIANDSESMASISTCDGLRGFFQTAAQRYLIEPLSDDTNGDHAVIKYEDAVDGPTVCGVTNTSWFPDFPPRTGKSRSRAAYRKFMGDINAVRKRMFEIVNIVNIIYKPLNTFIALTGLEIWTDQDKMVVSPSSGNTLDSFTTWRKNQQEAKRHDNAQLVSNVDFDGPTVGLAFVGTLCSEHSTGIIQDHNIRAVAVGATMTHEMGHNLGMSHDTSSCLCPDGSCIMAATLSYDIPEKFSKCSTENYNQFLNSRNPECMLNKPDFRKLIATPVCGNGFLETGEECDCGSVKDCTNPCCNATRCTLTAGSQCAAGDCCENCKILSSSRECRKKRDDCDLPERCDGKSAECPEDVFAVNGLPCQTQTGYCYNGQCPQRDNQCIRIWGPNAVSGHPNCYEMNSKGVNYAYCTRTATSYVPCQKRDVLCGKLFCSGGKDKPESGSYVLASGGQCKVMVYDDPANDFGQVEAGTKCGVGMVCSQNKCVDLQMAYRASNCSAKCHGHGVCDHRNECWCEPGWLPPSCSDSDGSVQRSSGTGPPDVPYSTEVSEVGLDPDEHSLCLCRGCRPRDEDGGGCDGDAAGVDICCCCGRLPCEAQGERLGGVFYVHTARFIFIQLPPMTLKIG